MNAATREGNHKLRAPEDVIAYAARLASALTERALTRRESRRDISAGDVLRLLLVHHGHLAPSPKAWERARLDDLRALLTSKPER